MTDSLKTDEPGADNLPPTLENDVQTSEWYYEENGQRNGPVPQAELENLIKMEKISYGSLIWKKGFTDWIKVENSELSSYLQSATPPPLSGDHVKNTYMWILAFAPILGYVLESFIAGQKYGVYIYTGEFWYTTLALNILLCIFDSVVLKKAGHDTSKFIFWFFLIPVYIYSRAKHLKQSQICLIIWVVAFALTLLLSGTELNSKASTWQFPNFLSTISGFGDSKAIKLVKSGKFHNCPGKTVEQAVNGFLGSPTWESGIGVDGQTKGLTLVNIRGRMTVHGKEVNALLQLIVDENNGTFNAHALEFNAVPQPGIMMMGVISKMCE